jgi:HD-GYP domain-containing protein (c-di-GMP phosphodiesterase class II)
MTTRASPPPETRLAELVSALSFAADLSMGQAVGWGLRGCLLATRLCERLEPSIRNPILEDVYYLSLLHYLGCTTDSHLMAQLFGNDQRVMQHFALTHMGSSARVFGSEPSLVSVGRTSPETFRESAKARCEVAMRLARWCHLSETIQTGLWQLFERWDGSGLPYGLEHEQIILPVRIVQIAQDAETFFSVAGLGAVKTLLAERAGHGYDPDLAALFQKEADELFASLETTSLYQAVLEAEPGLPKHLTEQQTERFLEVMADFADIKSPFLVGHARGVSGLAAHAASLAERSQTTLRWAGLVHTLGRVAIPTALWEEAHPFSDTQWERVRLYPYYTERVLVRCQRLRDTALLASMVQERLDGSGYFRGLGSAGQPLEVRLLAAANVYQALTEDRPYRKRLGENLVQTILREEVGRGHLDAEAVTYVLKAAGHAVRQRKQDYTGGLSHREVEVLRCLAKGHSNKTIAELLAISAKTVDHHVQHIYTKLGVSSRAAATLFAMQHDLIHEM